MQFCWSPIKTQNPYQGVPFEVSLSQAFPSYFQASPIFIINMNSYCSQFLSISQALTQELILNNTLINMRTSHPPQIIEAQETGDTDPEPKIQVLNKNTSQLQVQESHEEKNENHKEIKRRKKVQKDSDCESYVPQSQSLKRMTSSNLCESKNIPKNYGKAIMIFVQKNKAFVQRVLNHLGINYRDFMRQVHQVKNKLNTILQLKALWLQEENPFAKAYRIISMEYLRKRSLPYIFNSRVGNFHKHIKYRYKIIESVSDPRNFTIMKEF